MIDSGRDAAGSIVRMMVFVSWNGATEVAKWVLWGCEEWECRESVVLQEKVREGFETRFEVVG